jgi:NADPH-dependent 2,4-dienoyl-CoA reductase/sulfur reductase-like enzyme
VSGRHDELHPDPVNPITPQEVNSGERILRAQRSSGWRYEMSPLRVLVVGAGVGGISIARGLLRDGHDVTVFEKRPDVTAGGGAVTIVQRRDRIGATGR